MSLENDMHMLVIFVHYFFENKYAMMQHDRIKASTLDMAGPYQMPQDQNFGTNTENQKNHGYQQNLVTNSTCTCKNQSHPHLTGVV